MVKNRVLSELNHLRDPVTWHEEQNANDTEEQKGLLINSSIIPGNNSYYI